MLSSSVSILILLWFIYTSLWLSNLAKYILLICFPTKSILFVANQRSFTGGRHRLQDLFRLRPGARVWIPLHGRFRAQPLWKKLLWTLWKICLIVTNTHLWGGGGTIWSKHRREGIIILKFYTSFLTRTFLLFIYTWSVLWFDNIFWISYSRKLLRPPWASCLFSIGPHRSTRWFSWTVHYKCGMVWCWLDQLVAEKPPRVRSWSVRWSCCQAFKRGNSWKWKGLGTTLRRLDRRRQPNLTRYELLHAFCFHHGSLLSFIPSSDRKRFFSAQCWNAFKRRVNEMQIQMSRLVRWLT